LSHSDNPDEKAKALQLLWLATEKGNVDAEMELADLYARGDGVARSCVQARILLKAASAVNAAAAQPKLDALDQSGCS
jgi:TPR repeat protein